MKHQFYSLFLLFATLGLFLSACNKDEPFVLFPLEQDVALGAQVHEEILSMPDSLPILSQQQYPQAYQYLTTVMDRITASPDGMSIVRRSTTSPSPRLGSIQPPRTFRSSCEVETGRSR